MKTLKRLNVILILIIGSACSMADYKPESISKYQAGEIETVILGTIIQLESVVIEGNRDLGAAAAAVGADWDQTMIKRLLLQVSLELLLAQL